MATRLTHRKPALPAGSPSPPHPPAAPYEPPSRAEVSSPDDDGSAQRILVVGNDPETLAVAAYFLLSAGYIVTTARTGVEGVAALERQRFHAVVVSATLLDVSGLEIARRMRATGALRNTGLLVLMGPEHSHSARLDALALGADEALPRPLDPRELLLRVDAVLRRLASRPTGNAETMTVGPIQIDTAAHLVTIARTPVHLTPTEYRLLRVLAQHSGRLQTKHQLREAVWRNGAAMGKESRALEVQVWRLRQKLGTAGHLLETVAAEGYRLRRPRSGAA